MYYGVRARGLILFEEFQLKMPEQNLMACLFMNVEHDYQFLYLVDDRWIPDLSVEEIFNMRILTDCNILINKVYKLYTLIQKGSHSEVFEEFAKRVGEQEAHNYITALRSSASKSRSPSLESRKRSADAQQTVENKRKKLSSVKVRYQRKVMFNKLRFSSITFIDLKKWSEF